MIEAAIADQGVALGWAGLIDGAVQRGQLVHACDRSLTSENGYWLVFNPDISDTARALAMELIETPENS